MHVLPFFDPVPHKMSAFCRCRPLLKRTGPAGQAIISHQPMDHEQYCRFQSDPARVGPWAFVQLKSRVYEKRLPRFLL
jgi:hypothetical protein